MSKPVLISVIIPFYNGSLLIRRCLDSVFSQTGDVYTEVIIIDDGSTDNSVEIVRNYPKTIKLLQQENQGPAAARNRGIEAASGKYLAFLDADDYWLPDFLKETVRFLEESPEIIAVSTGQLHKIPGKPDTIAPAILKTDPEKYSQPVVLPDYFSFWAEHNHVCTGSVLMRTDIGKQTGGQRPELRITEDLEFWAYLATFGKWGFIPKVLFVSDGGAVTKARGWLEKNMKRWESAPTIEEWESRIIVRLPDPAPVGYLSARGRIAWNLAYSMIMSSRDKVARATLLKNKDYLPKNRFSKLLMLASKPIVSWLIITKLLRIRETHRKL